jgi:hypothetical protein
VARKKRLGEHFPQMGEILLLSGGGNTYSWICSTFIKCVVGSTIWSRRYFKELLSDIATESDESFMLLTIENNYTRWMAEAAYVGRDDVEKPRFPDALYTNSGCSTHKGKGSSRRFHGWSKEGYLRFNELYGMVKEDRKRRSHFEYRLKEVFEKSQQSAHVMGNEYDTDDDEIIPANDMLGVKQPAWTAKNINNSEDETSSSNNEDEEDDDED